MEYASDARGVAVVQKMTLNARPAMNDDTKYWNTSKIDVRFNHWEVDPIIDRIPVKLVATYSVALCDGHNHEHCKHLGGTLSLSTIAPFNSGNQVRREDDSSNIRIASDRDYDPEIIRPSGSPGGGRSTERNPVDEIEVVPQNAISSPNDGIKFPVYPDSSLYPSRSAPMTRHLPESTYAVTSVCTTARKIVLTPPLTPLAAEQSQDGFKNGFTDPELPVSARQSRALPADDSLLQHERDTTRAVDESVVRKRTSHRSRLGQIRPEDILLLQWLDAAPNWPWILQERQRLGFAYRARATLLRRRRLVKAALHHAGMLANSQLLARVALGDPKACRLLNAHRPASWTSDDFKTAGNLLRIQPSRSEHGPVMRSVTGDACYTPAPDSMPPLLMTTKAHTSGDDEYDYNARVTTGGKKILLEVDGSGTMDTDDEELSIQRATTGGKTILPDIDTMERVETNDEDLGTISNCRPGPPSEVSPEDYCHYTYQLWRQEFYSAGADNVHEAMQAADSAPMLCSTYDNIHKCNNAVTEELFKQYPGIPVFVTGLPGEEWDLKYATGENAEVTGTIFMKGVGALCAWTQRLLRTFHDGIPPKSRAGHLARAVYTVHKQITKSFKDELFGEEGHHCCDDEIFRDNVFTSLRQANEIAIDIFVKTTAQHSTGRINDVLAAIQRKKRQCTDEVDIDAELFDRTHGSKRVCVRKLRLCGPTNL